MEETNTCRSPRPISLSGSTQLPQSPRGPMEFLSRSWSASALEVSKALAPPPPHHPPCIIMQAPPNNKLVSASTTTTSIPEDITAESEELAAAAAAAASASAHQFSFASSATSQLVLERIMSQSEVSPLTSGRLSHSSGPLNGGSLTETDSPPVSPSEEFDDIVKYFRCHNSIQPLFINNRATAAGNGCNTPSGRPKTVGRWLKERKEKKKEENRAHNAQIHAAVSVAAVAAAVAAITAATYSASSSSRKNEQSAAKTDTAVVASAATLVAAQCVEAAETMGAERDHLASVINSAVNVRSHDDIVTLTAAAATALRGAATLKARAMKEVLNIAAALPPDQRWSNGGGSVGGGEGNNKANYNDNFSGELGLGEDFLSACGQELLAKGAELMKRTRKGDLHWKIVSVYINKTGQVMLKMKSKLVKGTITKKKKNVVLEVCKDMPAWPGRHLLLESGEQQQQRRYFGLKTEARGVVEFECRNQREYDVWTLGVSRLLAIAAEKRSKDIKRVMQRLSEKQKPPNSSETTIQL